MTRKTVFEFSASIVILDLMNERYPLCEFDRVRNVTSRLRHSRISMGNRTAPLADVWGSLIPTDAIVTFRTRSNSH